MVDEQYDDKYDTHEESEYHFSDDQANYEMELDGVSAKNGSVTLTQQSTSNIADKLKQHRRVVVGLLVFIILLGIVYKLISPSSTAPTTDFAAATAPTVGHSAALSPAPKPVVKAAPTVPPPATVQPAAAAPAVTTVAQAVQPTAPLVQPSAPPIAAPQPVVQAPLPTPIITQPANETANNHLQDRVITVEQQNAAMMNMLQTQYAQKIADIEAQNTQLRADAQELKARISSMEVAFRQLTKMLRDTRSAPAPQRMEPNPMSSSNDSNAMYDNPPPARIAQAPKTGYTVQAIIPGRAWLKSEAGETVTVAEGDVLKDFGRVTKIDPYDGLVNIDTGHKMITLSYGVNGD